MLRIVFEENKRWDHFQGLAAGLSAKSAASQQFLRALLSVLTICLASFHNHSEKSEQFENERSMQAKYVLLAHNWNITYNNIAIVTTNRRTSRRGHGIANGIASRVASSRREKIYFLVVYKYTLFRNMSLIDFLCTANVFW